MHQGCIGEEEEGEGVGENGDRGDGANRGRGGYNQNSDTGSGGARPRGNDGLNPNRQKGFNWQARIVTPTLNDMKAKQGAVVRKFMTFMGRKNSVMIELYERAFYNKKPGIILPTLCIMTCVQVIS